MHPDKNPDNPKAAELFHLLSKALEILTNVTARAAYDRILMARKAAEIRHKQLDSKRQKLKADLEAREKEAEKNKTFRGNYKTSKTDEEILKEEFDRLRTEGSKLLEEEQEYLRKEIHQETSASTFRKASSIKYRLKIKWKSEKNDSSNGGYNHENLTKFLQKYGEIVALVVSDKKGRALVEFEGEDAADMALQYEKGNLENPLEFEWISGERKTKKPGPTVTTQDFESLVLRQMRQAEERKRLIEQMMKEENENGDN